MSLETQKTPARLFRISQGNPVGSVTPSCTEDVSGTPPGMRADFLAPTGAEIYLKRKRSPRERVLGSAAKKQNITPVTTKNRFNVLTQDDVNEPTDGKRDEKPVPIHVRGIDATTEIEKVMKELKIDEFDVKVMKRGLEAKLQLFSIDNYRRVQKVFTTRKIPFYTYQLKSERALRVVIKGLHPSMSTNDISTELSRLGFSVRNVINCENRYGEKTSAFRVELNIESDQVYPHPIYDLRRFMHFVVNVEEPHKSRRPLQCHNCQEFGHSCNRCHLSAICVICSGRHPSSECDKDERDTSAKKCNNCGKNHTANYRGCQVYREFYERMNPRQRREQRIAKGGRKRQDIESLRDKQQKSGPVNPFDKSFAQVMKKGLPDTGTCF